MRRSLLVIALVGCGAVAPNLGASAPAPNEVAAVEGDFEGGKRGRAHLDRDGQLHIEFADHPALSVPLPGPVGIGATLTLVRHPEALLIHARAPQAAERVAELVVRLDRDHREPIFSGVTGPDGDGERREHLEVTEERVVRYQTAPEIVRCDGERRLFAEAFDFAAGRFRPVAIDPPSGASLEAAPDKPGKRKPLGLFRFRSASTSAGAGRKADRIGAPEELEDEDGATAWVAGPAGGGKGQWVTAHARSGTLHAKALSISPGPGGFPNTLAIVTGEAPSQHFTVVPKDRKQPISVELPPAARSSCLSIVLGDTPASAGGAAGLSEVAIYTEADEPGGVDLLVHQVAEGSSGADAASQALIKLGPAGLQQVIRQLRESRGEARGRLLRVLYGDLALDRRTSGLHPTIVATLTWALTTSSSLTERHEIADHLASCGASALYPVGHLYIDKSQTDETRAEAAALLGRFAVPPSDDTELQDSSAMVALTLLLDAAGRGSPALRRATRQALAAAVHRQVVTARVLDALSKEVKHSDDDTHPDEARLIDLVVPLGRVQTDSPKIARALLAAWQIAPGAAFELRLRLLRALGQIRESTAASVFATVLKNEHEEVLRAVAAEGAANLPGGEGRGMLLKATGDRDPRVRSAAIEGLGRFSDREVSRQIARSLREDFWPMVRLRAADQLGPLCKHQPDVAVELRRAIFGIDERLRGADPTEEVRRGALLSLEGCPDEPVTELKKGLLPRQPFGVRELSAVLLGKRGGSEAAHAIAKAMDEVLGDPEADERAVGFLTSGLRALARAGVADTTVLEVIGESAHEPSSPAIRAAAMQTIGALCPDGAQRTLQKGTKDPVGEVARAASEALRRCPK